MSATVREVTTLLEGAYPPELAEDWDTGIGLTCGDPGDQVDRVLLAVDIDDAVVAQAVQWGAQLVVTHHPLLFRPVQSVSADTTKGRLVHQLIRSGIAHFAAHTNADKAVGGVNDALAGAIGLEQVRPLVPDVGLLHAAHPQHGLTGMGRIGDLPSSMSLQDFTELVAAALPGTVGGVCAAGDPDRRIRTVALCGGAGDSQLATAGAAGADVYLTSDLRHHVVSEHLARPGAVAVVEVAHFAGEWPWLARAAAVIADGTTRRGSTGTVMTTVSALRTDPWTIHRPSTRLAGAVDRSQLQKGSDTCAEG
jgi:dinuclear metal center YbgI/SA1388 family protein